MVTLNQTKKYPSARNVSFCFVYNVHQSDTCLPETRAPMGVLHRHYTKVKCVVVAAWRWHYLGIPSQQTEWKKKLILDDSQQPLASPSVLCLLLLACIEMLWVATYNKCCECHLLDVGTERWRSCSRMQFKGWSSRVTVHCSTARNNHWKQSNSSQQVPVAVHMLCHGYALQFNALLYHSDKMVAWSRRTLLGPDGS